MILNCNEGWDLGLMIHDLAFGGANDTVNILIEKNTLVY